MFLIKTLGISRNLANALLDAVLAGQVIGLLGALVPGPGWLLTAAMETAETIVENSGKFVAASF